MRVRETQRKKKRKVMATKKLGEVCIREVQLLPL